MTIIAPSILAADFTRLGEQLRDVESAGIDWWHCDVMDGHFVPNLSFGPFIIKQINQMSNLPLDVHLMISNPERYVDAYIDAGADYLTVHGEVIGDDDSILGDIRKRGAKPGLSLNPNAAIEDYFPLFDKIDLFLVMSVYAGFGGQKFIADVLNKVRTAVEWREKYGYKYLISIDGGINLETAPLAKAAGVDIMVTGTALFKAPNIPAFIKSLKART
ncbi:MAG: ribulose-phosphate 3-epimerase [Candidatus Zixiibacteriota bacterium]